MSPVPCALAQLETCGDHTPRPVSRKGRCLERIGGGHSLRVNGARYSAYREVTDSLERIRLRPVESDLLRDAAEGFLLARALEDPEVGELGLVASITLERVVNAKRISSHAATRLRTRIERCGPPGSELPA
jgi:hypothetical protein